MEYPEYRMSRDAKLLPHADFRNPADGFLFLSPSLEGLGEAKCCVCIYKSRRDDSMVAMYVVLFCESRRDDIIYVLLW